MEKKLSLNDLVLPKSADNENKVALVADKRDGLKYTLKLQGNKKLEINFGENTLNYVIFSDLMSKYLYDEIVDRLYTVFYDSYFKYLFLHLFTNVEVELNPEHTQSDLIALSINEDVERIFQMLNEANIKGFKLLVESVERELDLKQKSLIASKSYSKEFDTLMDSLNTIVLAVKDVVNPEDLKGYVNMLNRIGNMSEEQQDKLIQDLVLKNKAN